MLSFSLIVPTFNRARLLRRTLWSLVKQNTSPSDYEILIVDNGSNDDTKAIAQEIISSNPGNQIRYVFEPVPGLLSARHRGALEAEGSVLVFVDDDIEASQEWLSAIQESLTDPTVHLVTGANLPHYESTPSDWLNGLWYHNENGSFCPILSLLDLGNTRIDIDPCFVWGLNFTIRTESLFDLGGFHPDCIPKRLQKFQGDGETGLSLKARGKGLKAIYNPKALIHHYVPNHRVTPGYIWQRSFYQGVCDSFTQIRATRGANIQKGRSATGYSRTWGRKFLHTANSIGCCLGLRVLKSNRLMKRFFETGYRAGFTFHQREVQNSPGLLNWVLRENYWDYQLPDL